MFSPARGFCSVRLACFTGRLAYHQLRFHRNLLGMIGVMFLTVATNPPQNGFGGNLPHLSQRLPHRGEPGILIGSALNVVEAHHRYIFRHAQSLFPQGANRADRRNVIERKDRREGLVFRQQTASHPVTQIGGWYLALQLRRQLWINGEAKLGGRLNNCVPARFRVRTELLTFDKSDAPVSELEQVLQCQLRRAAMIEHDVSDNVSYDGSSWVRNLVDFVMSRNRHHWNG